MGGRFRGMTHYALRVDVADRLSVILVALRW